VLDDPTRLARQGPVLLVDIGFDPGHFMGDPGTPIPGERNIEALIDTGAGESCIDSQVAERLKLPLIDREQRVGAFGGKEVDVYLAQIHVPSLAMTIYGRFAAVELIMSGQPYEALLGRTFLRHVRLIYDGIQGKLEIETAPLTSHGAVANTLSNDS
jgi:predicted aspartyl protease